MGRLQKLSGLQKLSTISKSSLAAYNDHVQNTADNTENFDSTVALYSTLPSSEWSPPSLRPKLPPLSSFPLQRGILSQLQPSNSLVVKSIHSTAATKASPAFLKTKELFRDDRQFALEQVQASSPRIAVATPQHVSQHTISSTDQQAEAVNDQQHHLRAAAPPLARSHSDSSADSLADSVSSYHGYAGVNYQSGIKDIDAVPNQWGYSLSDYKAVFGDKYVHGCVPWENQHIDKQSQKKFQRLHSQRVQLLRELHDIEQGIRELMQ